MLKKYVLSAMLLVSHVTYAAPDVSIVFDGSGSMCGYFTPNDSNRVLLNLIQEAKLMVVRHLMVLVLI